MSGSGTEPAGLSAPPRRRPRHGNDFLDKDYTNHLGVLKTAAVWSDGFEAGDLSRWSQAVGRKE